ncbi:MAG: tetratricopeptide repeat protein [Bryobacteraceae bacterium]|nr:tetratricopeptide repeat protein [Bryobacteraceae bacterium]
MGKFVFALLAAAALASAQPSSKAFEHFYSLEYDEAIAEFDRALKADAENPDRYNHLAQAILYRAMYRAGALESELVTGNNPFLRREKVNPSPEDQKRFDEAVARAIQLSDARVAKNPNEVGALYSRGVAYGLKANYDFLVRKAWMDALKDATTARKAHNRVTELDANFVDARLVQGVHDYVVGSLPFTYKILGFLVGYRGDKETGIRTLQLVADKGTRNNFDAAVLLAAVYRRERRAKEAIPLVERLVSRFPRNYLLRFELAQMYGDVGNKEAALNALAKIEELKRANTPGYQRVPLEKILFSRGNLQFWYKDLDAAIDNLQKVTAKANDLDLNTGVYAWLRLGQSYDLKGRRSEAQAAYRSCINYAPQSEAARESRKYLDSPYRRKEG